MCKLLEHTINNGDRRLSDIIVKGDRHVDHETGIIFIHSKNAQLVKVDENNIEHCFAALFIVQYCQQYSSTL